MFRVFLSGLSVILIMASCSSTTKIASPSYSVAHIMPAKGQHGPNANGINEELIVTSFVSSHRRLLDKSFNPKMLLGKASKLQPLHYVSEPSELQEKYAAILNVMPSLLSNIPLLATIDEWYGTRYRYGGSSKSGIDCSAFTRVMFKSVFQIELPRTAREQYWKSRRISTTELKEGDLVFFNTTGGISHVGMYLRNNKFVHSSSSKGVVISDLYEPYYLSHFIGATRVVSAPEKEEQEELTFPAI